MANKQFGTIPVVLSVFGMKNKIAPVLAGLVLCLVCAGCVSNKTYDESLPQSKQCTLIVSSSTGHGITLFDGKNVNWKPPFALSPYMASCKVIIPAGKHTISNGVFQPLEYVFAAGKTYKVSIPFGKTYLEIKEE